MDPIRAILIIEGRIPANDAGVLSAWQALVDTGIMRTLPRRYQRIAQAMKTMGALRTQPSAVGSWREDARGA